LEDVHPPVRLRLGSIEPLEFDDALLARIASTQRVCRHFHIPLQSGSASVLRHMNRRYTPEIYEALIWRLHRSFPEAALAADIMVGFPGETEGDHEATCQLLESLPLMDLHVFKYSRRPHTAAYAMADQVEEPVKARRSTELRRLAHLKKRRFLEGLVGAELEVVVEKEITPSLWAGLSGQYVTVQFPFSEPERVGRLISVRGEGLLEDGLSGRVLTDR
jgi:threonylcarbamoyladenosine tRNA methylthiotransferase MtaB